MSLRGGPLFDHDCEHCTYLGRVGEYDVYVCPQAGMPTIIMRFGDDGPEYASGKHLVDQLPGEMVERAVELQPWLRR